MKRLLFQSSLIFLISGLVAVKASDILDRLSQESINLVKVFEVVIAGVVASAVVLSLLALFVGQWSGKKQNATIKKIRQDVENDKEITEKAVINVEESAAEAQHLIRSLSNKTSAITSKQHQAWLQVEDIEQLVEDAIDCNTELKQTTDGINQRMIQIQNYWEGQLKDTEEVVRRVQSTLEQGLASVESGLEALQEKKMKSQDLSQQVLDAYKQQSSMLAKNAHTSEDIRLNLDQAFADSKHLLTQLNTHKKSAEKSFQQFNDDLGSYESQAYDQFDSSFQATDIARKELDANVNESRLQVENIRRYETEGRNIKLQARKHLDLMSAKSMDQFSSTLENTQQIFAALQDDVQDAQYAIDSLRKMKHQIQESTEEHSHENKEEGVTTSKKQVDDRLSDPEVSLAISGDSTLVPFFSGRK